MTQAIDYYASKSKDLPRYIYRNLAEALRTAADAPARAALIDGFTETVRTAAATGSFLKFKWVMPDYLRSVLTPAEEVIVRDVLAQRRKRQGRKLFDVFPHCSDEFSLSPEFLAATFDATARPLFDKSTPVFTIGSCFARNIGLYLRQNGYAAENYNQSEDLNSPFSNAAMVVAAISEPEARDAYLRWWLRAILADATDSAIDDACRAEVRSLDSLRQRIASSKLLIITLGNTVDYHLTAENTAPILREVRVAPKFLGIAAVEDVSVRQALTTILRKQGTELRLGTFEETIAAIRALHESVRKINPTAPIIYTLSPVPINSAMGLQKAAFDGAIEADCISKSTLRAAISQLIATERDKLNCHYFPSYEIVRWIGGMLPIANFGQQDAASHHVSAEILDAIYGFFLHKHALTATDATAIQAADA